MLDHKVSFNNFRKTKIIQSIFSDHNHIKLELQEKKTKERHKYGNQTTYHQKKERERLYFEKMRKNEKYSARLTKKKRKRSK